MPGLMPLDAGRDFSNHSDKPTLFEDFYRELDDFPIGVTLLPDADQKKGFGCGCRQGNAREFGAMFQRGDAVQV
jgi:hypothetical protein